MKECEIFLSRLDEGESLYRKTAVNLGLQEASVCCREELFRQLCELDEPTEARIYISDEDIKNEAADEIAAAFEEASCRNKNLTVSTAVEEFLNIIGPDERITAESKPRSLIHRDGDLHPTVHVWIISRKDMGVYVLLQKRSEQKLLHPGCYDVSAAGHVTQGGEFREAAVRELQEELGLEIQPQKLEFIGIIRNSAESNGMIDNELSAVYLYNEPVDTDSLKLQSSEVDEVCWGEIDEILSIMNRGDFKNCISVKELEIIKKAEF